MHDRPDTFTLAGINFRFLSVCTISVIITSIEMEELVSRHELAGEKWMLSEESSQ